MTLLQQVEKEIKEARKNREFEIEKRNIRMMLSIIENKEKRIELIQNEIKDIKDSLGKGDYSLVMPIVPIQVQFIR